HRALQIILQLDLPQVRTGSPRLENGSIRTL
ncbi:MAG: hypothetical protein ACJAVQ_001930, partial [Nonlabens sp.]